MMDINVFVGRIIVFFVEGYNFYVFLKINFIFNVYIVVVIIFFIYKMIVEFIVNMIF